MGFTSNYTFGKHIYFFQRMVKRQSPSYKLVDLISTGGNKERDCSKNANSNCIKVLKMKAIIFDTTLIGLSAALLWHFSNVWRYGQYLIGEPNIVIRGLETAAILIIFAVGVTKYVKDITQQRNKRNKKRFTEK